MPNSLLLPTLFIALLLWPQPVFAHDGLAVSVSLYSGLISAVVIAALIKRRVLAGFLETGPDERLAARITKSRLAVVAILDVLALVIAMFAAISMAPEPLHGARQFLFFFLILPGILYLAIGCLIHGLLFLRGTAHYRLSSMLLLSIILPVLFPLLVCVVMLLAAPALAT